MHVTIILILLNQTTEAVALPKEIQIQKTSKQWNKYNLKAIITVMSAEFRNNHSSKVPLVPSFLEKAHRKFEAMLNVSKSRYIGSYFPSMVSVRKPFGEFQKVMKFKTKPLSQIEENIFFRRPGYPLYLSYTFTWFFHLDWKLELNLTIHHTYFSSFLSSKCFFGNLTLLPYIPNETKFIYCGQYPVMSNYLRSNVIDIILAVERFVAFDVVISHSVIDYGILKSVSLKLKKTRIQTLSWTQVFPVDKLFYIFYLSVEKFKTLSLGINNHIYRYSLVYDGPDYSRYPLQPVQFRNNMSWYLSKTFQCIVSLFFFTSDLNHAFEWKYFSRSTKNISKLTLDKTKIKWLNFPNANCPVNYPVCVIEVTVNSNSMVNMTFHHLTYNGQVHSLCNFGGLTTYDNINGTYIEISTICKPHNGVFKNRNIYSKNISAVTCILSV